MLPFSPSLRHFLPCLSNCFTFLFAPPPLPPPPPLLHHLGVGGQSPRESIWIVSNHLRSNSPSFAPFDGTIKSKQRHKRRPLVNDHIPHVHPYYLSAFLSLFLSIHAVRVIGLLSAWIFVYLALSDSTTSDHKPHVYPITWLSLCRYSLPTCVSTLPIYLHICLFFLFSFQSVCISWFQYFYFNCCCW